MKKSLIAVVFAAILLSISVPGWCESPVLWQDPATGQLFSKPADGRTPVDPVKDLQLPPSAVGSLYEDENGTVYTKPGPGRTQIAVAPEAIPAPQASPASAAPSDYSSQAFKDAVNSVIGEKESKTFPKVKVGGLIYGEYSYDFDKRNTTADNGHNDPRNKFTLNRSYINVRTDMTPEISARITPDITRAGNGDWELRLKYGYVDFHNFLNFYPSLDVKMGQYETCWLDYEEGLWEYRVLDPMLIEKEGFFNSGDLGVGLKGNLPAGFGNWAVDVINGEGYHADEANKYKTVQGRLTLTPLPMYDLTKGLHLTAFASTGKQDFLHKRDRYIGFLGYKYKDQLFLAGEYDITRGKDSLAIGVPGTQNNVEGHGFSALAWARMPFLQPLRLVGRFDRFDHNDDKADSTIHRWYYGASYDIGKNVMFVLDNERTVADHNVAVKNENLLKADVQVQF